MITDALCKRSIALPNCFHGIQFTLALAYAELLIQLRHGLLAFPAGLRVEGKKAFMDFPRSNDLSPSAIHVRLPHLAFSAHIDFPSILLYFFTSLRVVLHSFSLSKLITKQALFVCSTWLKVIMLGGNH